MLGWLQPKWRGASTNPTSDTVFIVGRSQNQTVLQLEFGGHLGMLTNTHLLKLLAPASAKTPESPVANDALKLQRTTMPVPAARRNGWAPTLISLVPEACLVCKPKPRAFSLNFGGYLGSLTRLCLNVARSLNIPETRCDAIN
jgi:hypothetical protein